MRIVAWVNKDSGPAYHRIIMPLMLMEESVKVFITNNLLDEHFKDGCDIFIYNRIMPAHAMPKIRELQKQYGFKICVDIDDYWYLDDHHVLHDLYIQEDFAAQQIGHIAMADFVLTTHERLADEIKAFNPNVHICANAIPAVGQFVIKVEPYYLTRIFWQGSVTHREDIELLARPIHSLNKLSEKIKMIMGGYQETELEWKAMALTYTAGLKHQYKLLPGLPVTKYYSMYENADVCLVPLVNSPFNKMKSNLKVLEAANAALPVIASDVHPYKDMPILYCNNPTEWLKAIRRMVKSENLRRDMGEGLKVWAYENYNFFTINKERQQVFEHEASKQTIFR